MKVDLKLVAEYAKALSEAEQQNAASDAALRGLHKVLKQLLDDCEAEAKKRGFDLGQ